MRRKFTFPLCGLALLSLGLLVANSAPAATAEESLVSQLTAERHGLNRAWYLQLPVGARNHVTAVVPDRDLILVSTDAAMIYAVEAETGRLVWSAQVGDARHPTLRPAGNGPASWRKAAKPAAEAAPSPGDTANANSAAGGNVASAEATGDKAAAADAANPDAAGGPAPAADAPAGEVAAGANAAAPLADAAASPASPASPATSEAPAGTFKAEDGKIKPILRVVAVVNGTDLYLLNRSDGLPLIDEKSHEQWKVSLRNTPMAGPVVGDQFVYVPTAGSRVEIYDITDLKDGVKYGNGSGDVTVPPVRFGKRIAWCSDKGVVNLTLPDGTTVRGVETGEPVAAPISAEWPHVYVGTLNGSLFSIPETGEQYFWKFSVGSPIRQRPIGLPDAVYVLPDDGGMFRVAPADGKQQWFNAESRNFLASSPTKVYTMDGLGRMLVLDAKTGSAVDSIQLPAAVVPVANSQTDRILLASADGLLQSMHEAELTDPQDYITEPAPPPLPVPPPPKPKAKPPAEKPKPADDTPKPEKPKPAPTTPPVTKPKTPRTPRGKAAKPGAAAG